MIKIFFEGCNDWEGFPPDIRALSSKVERLLVKQKGVGSSPIVPARESNADFSMGEEWVDFEGIPILALCQGKFFDVLIQALMVLSLKGLKAFVYSAEDVGSSPASTSIYQVVA